MQERASIGEMFISFMRGVVSIGGASGPINPYEGLNPEEADAKALRSDWKAVGNDIKTAIKEYQIKILKNDDDRKQIG